MSQKFSTRDLKHYVACIQEEDPEDWEAQCCPICGELDVEPHSVAQCQSAFMADCEADLGDDE